MRFLTADYLYPLHISPIKEGVLQISDKGEVLHIFNTRDDIPFDNLEIFKGSLCPGFINAHCHLELSHLKGIVEERKGFLNFIETVKQRNNYCKEEVLDAITESEKQMIKNGIVAVGDICNTTDTLLQKQKNNIHYYNFIEIFQIEEDKIERTLKKILKIRDAFREVGEKATIVPHAPFSVPSRLMQKIANNFDKNDELFSIHMQETEAENELFKNKNGSFYTWLTSINASPEIWKKRAKSIDVLEELGNNKMLLVHNTFTLQEEITDNYYCTCPRANLYIENSLPDYRIFDTDKLCIGTDSLASNNSFSILEELLIIQKNSNFELNTLLKIACKNGADALGFEKFGTFEKGKIPGVNLIEDLETVTIVA